MKNLTSILQRMHPLSKRFKGANLSGHDLSGWVFVGADIRGANLSGAYGADVDFRCADLAGADLSRIDFVNCLAAGASFRNANIVDAQIHDTYLNAADFRGATIKNLNTNVQGFHTRGVLMPTDFDPAQIHGGHDCHELVAAMLGAEFPNDLEMLQIRECIIARFISCWHGLVGRIRTCFPHRERDLLAVFEKYNAIQLLADRWRLGVAMAEAVTQADWLALRETSHYEAFPSLVDGWIRKTAKQNGWAL